MTGAFCKVKHDWRRAFGGGGGGIGEILVSLCRFLAFNLIDWLTGWAKSRMKGESCSKVGAIGAMKKVWYWVVIAIAFYIGYSFAQMGETIGVGLGFMQFTR